MIFAARMSARRARRVARGSTSLRGSLARALVTALLLVLVPSAHAGTDGAPDARITVERAATVPGKTVRLADVALLEGEARSLADLELGPAPEPGSTRRIDGTSILHHLRAAGLDESTTRYEIPASVRIDRAFQEVAADEIRTVLERRLAEQLGANDGLRSVELSGPVRIPLGGYELRVASNGFVGRGEHRRCDLEVLQEGATVATVPVRVEIVSYGKVVVARRALARGTRVGADDVAIEDRELDGSAAEYYADLSEVVGKEVRAAVAASSPIPVPALSKPIVVKRGDIVNVVAETSALRLSVVGEALESGALGAQIRVRNRQSKQELSAQVVAGDTVVVRY